MKYRKKPVVIEAFQLDRHFLNWPEWANYALTKKEIISDNMGKFNDPSKKSFVSIMTPEGVMVGNEGDFIIKGIKDEIYPCKPDIFLATYDLVEEK